MTGDREPLFNRTFLKVLAFIVALLIIVLSGQTDTAPEPPKAITEGPLSIYQLAPEQAQQQRLWLAYPSYPALTEQAQIERRLAINLLHKLAKREPVIESVNWLEDRLEIKLSWQQQAPQVFQLVAQLVDDSLRLASFEARQLVAARHYLDQHSPEIALENRFRQNLAGSFPSATRLDTVLQSPPIALVLSDDDDLAEQLQQQFATHYRGAVSFNRAKQRNLSPSFRQLPNRDSRQWWLIGQEMVQQTRHSAQLDLLALAAIPQALQLAQLDQLEYRLLRKPVFDGGFQAIVLAGADTLERSDFVRLSELAPQRLDEEQFTALKQQLIKRYAARIEVAEQRLEQQFIDLFYARQSLSESEYRDLLDAVELDQWQRQVANLLSRSRSQVLHSSPNHPAE